MTIFPHHLHIYEKPKLGNSFISRHLAYNYTHTISAMGWYDTASCNIKLTDKQAEMALDQWIGNRVAFYVDNPVAPIFEGLIARVTPEFGNVVPTRSLDNMFNRVKSIQKSQGNAIPTQSAAGDTTASQAIYGIKEGSIDAKTESGVTTGRRDAIRDFIIAHQAYPQTSLQFNPAGKIMRLEIIGIYHTLEWENVRIATATARNPANHITTNLLPNLANGATFFDNTVTTYVEANAAFTMTESNITGETVWQQLLKVTEPGDGSSGTHYIVGIKPTDPNTGARYLYYRAANSAIEYICYARDGARIRNQYGGLVNAWNVLPDRSLRVNDILVGWNGIGDDPREIYIEAVNYDAESQQVALQGADDTTIDGIIQAKRYYRAHNSRMGLEVREFV